MSSSQNLADFPDVHAKLQKPTKQSAFERQKAEAEAKRQREEAETAAVYEDFIKSFDRDDDDRGNTRGNHQSGGPVPSYGASVPGPSSRAGFGHLPPGGPSKRHFVATGLKSGPGSLGPPPSPFAKKRSFNDFSHSSRDRLQASNDHHAAPLSIPKAFNTSDDEEGGASVDRAEERAIAKPTLRLANLPPGTSPSTIKALLPSNLGAEDVKIQPPSNSSGSERRYAVAIVTLAQQTPANEIEAAVSSLQNRYLGYGYYLSLHRHLSSAVTSTTTLHHHLTSSAGESQPFGAKPVEAPKDPKEGLSQPGFKKGFAPPSSYNQPVAGVNRSKLLHVPVEAPKNIQTLRLINMVIEKVLEDGPEFEALLMSRSEVQREEKWAWIWDARNEGGVWYRWNVWEIISGGSTGQSKGRFIPLFDSSHAWKTPEKRLPFEHSTELQEFVSDSDYNSSDEEDIDGGEANRENGNENEAAFLNPLEKAKLSHLLARLPTSLSKLRKGDMARVTAFAVMHASRGVDEVVDIIVSNIKKPLSISKVNPDRKQGGADSVGTEEIASAEGYDVSAAMLIALYVVNDILSSSSTSGVRHAWRFRQLFENSLRDHKIFELLGAMAEKSGWGRLRAEKWKRSINLVLNLWEGWCVFPAQSQELFVHNFENPPVQKVENKAADPLKQSKWKVVEATKAEQVESPGDKAGDKDATSYGDPSNAEGQPVVDEDLNGEIIEDEDVDGEPIDEDDIDGEPTMDEDIDGEPMDEDTDADGDDMPPPTEVAENQNITKTTVEVASEGSNARDLPGGTGSIRKPRMRAADMFADSDESDEAK